MSKPPYYDLFRDASESAHDLAGAMRECIRAYKAEHPDVSDKVVADAIRWVGFKTEVDLPVRVVGVGGAPLIDGGSLRLWGRIS